MPGTDVDDDSLGRGGRKSDGLDTDNNASDCKGFNKPTAGAANN